MERGSPGQGHAHRWARSVDGRGAPKLNSLLIKARLSGMNIYHARTSKLVSDFLSLEQSLVTNSPHAACSRAGTWAAWAELVTKDRSIDKKSETSFEVLA